MRDEEKRVRNVFLNTMGRVVRFRFKSLKILQRALDE